FAFLSNRGMSLLLQGDAPRYICEIRRAMREHIPRVVIVGGGFGGLEAAKLLGPAHIGSPIRGIQGNQKNTTVIMGEVTGVDKDQKCVFVSDADRKQVPFAYDYLILATGARHSYFGHDQFEKSAPGLKSLADAVAIRNKILQ